MTVDVRPITDADVAAVADFLHTHYIPIPPSAWVRVMSLPWATEAPNHGFMLRDGQRLAGAYVALYSERNLAGQVERFCNLASWYVLPEYRLHSVRLLRALLAQDGYHFTDLSPDEKVQTVNARLKFCYLDMSAAFVPHLPWPTVPGRTKISADAKVIADTLTGPDLKLYRDHAQAPAVHHLVLIRGSEYCYVMFRKRRWKGRKVFATVHHVSNPSLFQHTAAKLGCYLLVHHRLLATIAELRIVGTRPRASFLLPYPEKLVQRHDSRITRSYAARYRLKFRPKMYRSSSLGPGQIDDLYSGEVCIPYEALD
jgi:hypothetical protein